MKKALLVAGLVAAPVMGLLAPMAFAGDGAAVEGILPIASTTLLADMVSWVPSLFNSVWPIIAIVLGIPLAFFVFKKLLGLGKTHTK